MPLRRELAALVARSPFGQVAAYPVVETVQRDGICVEVLAPAPGLSEELARRGAAARHRPGHTSSAWSACSPSSCSRPTTASWSTSWRCARTTPGTGPSRAPGRRSSSSTCGPCSTTRWATTSLTAPAVVMANVLGGEPGGMSHRRAAAPPVRRRPGGPGAPVRQAGPARPQDRPRHRAGRRHDRGTRPGRARRPLAAGRRSEWHRVVGVIMGSDSDWSDDGGGRQALAEFEVPFEVGVVSAHRTVRRDGRLRRRRRPTAACR